MTSQIQTASDYRDLPLDWLTVSPTNPRRVFDEQALEGMAASIRAQGVLTPLLVRPRSEHQFEIVFGERRYRAAQRAESTTVPVCIREMTDAEVLEAQLVENLQRVDVHPLDEARGFAALLQLDEPKYTVELIAAKCGKSPAYVAARLKFNDLAPAVVKAFAKDEIGVGHALLLAKLQPEQQEQALSACWQEVYTGGKSKHVLLPVRHLREWIERNVLLELAAAPFSKEDAQLLPQAGSCLECPKRTGHNTLLFDGLGGNHDSCSDPVCYTAKVQAHVEHMIAAKPKLVQISTAYGQPKSGETVLPRGKYVEIRQDKPKEKERKEWPEYKTCKFVSEAIVTDGVEKGELRKVCANPECAVHCPKKKQAKPDASFKAEQEKRRREEAQAKTTGLRVLKAIGDAVPVRLMKRDLLFVAQRLTLMLDEQKAAILIRQHGMGNSKEGNAPAKVLAAFLSKAEEGKLGRILVETAILLSMRGSTDTAPVLRETAKVYRVDVDAIAAKVKQEFSGKARGKASNKPATKSKTPTKVTKKAA